jgi:hypothetical protein
MNNFKIYAKSIIAIIIAITSFNSYSQVVINEYSASNLNTILDNYSSNEDWVELYNAGSTTFDLSGYYLSDNPEDSVKWQFPAGSSISANGFMKIWLSGRNEVLGGHYHANFKLTQTKTNPDFLVLTSPGGIIIEELQIQITKKDHSRGRKPNGSGNWVIFTTPTPGSSNNSALAHVGYTATPSFNTEPGFYSNPITVTITNNQPNSEIRYTLDGSHPTETASLYTGPINISTTTIINARSFSTDNTILAGLVNFSTYFINDPHSLAVISTSSESLDNLLNGNSALRPFGTIEFFNKQGIRAAVAYGEFNEHGQDSWVHPQRSMDYISRDECGYNYALKGKLLSRSDREEFQRLIFRAEGDDNYPGIDTSAHLRDFLIQNLAHRSHLHLDVRQGEKFVLYVNGQFWGVYSYREKVHDHDFTDYYYDQDKYHLYFLMLWGGAWAEYGGQAAWNDWNPLHDFILNNNMANQENYEYVKTKYDVTSLTDYIITNSFVVCSDWINWNVGWWRGTSPDGGHLKWGYILWDEDATFGHYINYTGIPGQNPYVSPCFPEGITDDPEDHIEILNALMENEEFKEYYVSRYVDLLNTVYRPDTMINFLDSIEGYVLPEMEAHCDRWGGSVAEWQTNVQKIRNFINTRYNVVLDGLNSCYDLNGPYEVNFAVSPTESGTIMVNSVTPPENPWGGYYYGGINTKLVAQETNPLYEFDKWILYNHEVYPNDTLEEVTMEFTTGDYILAQFKLKDFADSLVINEINYNSSVETDPGDWVEFYNPHEYELNISEWYFKDEADDHIFSFPAETVIDPFGYLVLCRDSVDFNSVFPGVENYLGEMDFGLSSTGELIRLFNAEDVLIDTVHYGVSDPWPSEPNGNGPTLELKYWQYDNALAESWVTSALNGTPGLQNSYIVGDKKTISFNNNFSFVIYPNPVSDHAIIQVTTPSIIIEGYMIEIWDVYGKLVKSYTDINADRFEFRTDGFNQGIYFCKFIDKNLTHHGTERFIVK